MGSPGLESKPLVWQLACSARIQERTLLRSRIAFANNCSSGRSLQISGPTFDSTDTVKKLLFWDKVVSISRHDVTGRSNQHALCRSPSAFTDPYSCKGQFQGFNSRFKLQEEAISSIKSCQRASNRSGQGSHTANAARPKEQGEKGGYVRSRRETAPGIERS